MKKTILLTLCLLSAAFASSAQTLKITAPDGQVQQYDVADLDGITFQETDGRGERDILHLHTAGQTMSFAVPAIDSLGFGGGMLQLFRAEGGVESFAMSAIDSLTFGGSADLPVLIDYQGDTVVVTNPLAALGLTVVVDGADVIVTDTSSLEGVTYALSGATSDGLFKITTDEDFNLRLDSVILTNNDGPAINIQADEWIYVELPAGTSSILTDGATYADPPNDEDQKATFFSEGQLIVSGEGSLEINGLGEDKHAFASDDYIQLNGGHIVLTGADKDGLHTNDGFILNGGTLEVHADSDGIDAGEGSIEITGGTLTVVHTGDDKGALKCDGQIRVSGGTLDISVSGDAAKGLDAGEVLLNGGNLDITTSGGVILESEGSGYDPTYCTAVKAETFVQIDGAELTITTTGPAGRGISSDGDIEILSGLVTITSSGGGGTYTNEEGQNDVYHGPCLKADGNQTIGGGIVTLNHSGSAGKGLTGDGDFTFGGIGLTPQLAVTTTGSSVYYSGNYAEAKAISVDGTVLVLDGEIYIDSADDGIKSKTRLQVDGGEITVVDSFEGMESFIMVINGGKLDIFSTNDGLNTSAGTDSQHDDGSELVINGGWIAIETTGGDSIDSNGTLEINGGTLLIHGPPNAPEVGLDINSTIWINGGLIMVAQVYSFHAETPSGQSDQACFVLRHNGSTYPANTLFHIEDAQGNALVTFSPDNRYSSVIFSSPDIASGGSYRVYTGGTCSGELNDGLYTGGVYSGGTLRTTVDANGGVQSAYF